MATLDTSAPSQPRFADRTRAGLPESRALAAPAVGEFDPVTGTVAAVLVAACTGRGPRPDRHAFPRRRQCFGFQTGAPARAAGSSNVPTAHGARLGARRRVTLLQRADGCTTTDYTTTKENLMCVPRSGASGLRRDDPDGAPVPPRPEEPGFSEVHDE